MRIIEVPETGRLASELKDARGICVLYQIYCGVPTIADIDEISKPKLCCCVRIILMVIYGLTRSMPPIVETMAKK